MTSPGLGLLCRNVRYQLKRAVKPRYCNSSSLCFIHQQQKSTVRARVLVHPLVAPFLQTSTRQFHSESEYHNVADETLEHIQEAVEEALEDKGVADFDVNMASGVLTMILEPHGTWVINKQTPNQQLWWSSPKSGPRRYEYVDGNWVFTRDESVALTLEQTLKEELREAYQFDLPL